MLIKVCRPYKYTEKLRRVFDSALIQTAEEGVLVERFQKHAYNILQGHFRLFDSDYFSLSVRPCECIMSE